MEKTGTKQNISAEAPLAEMQRYATDLRSMTQGRGSFTMTFDRYEEAPAEVQTKVIEARKKELEAMREKE
jgi:elongation factor G